MFSSIEVFILFVYFSTIFVAIAAIQYLNPGKAMRESFQVEDTNEKFAQAEFEEPESDKSEEKEEEFTMEENPMFRHRNVNKEIPWIEQVD